MSQSQNICTVCLLCEFIHALWGLYIWRPSLMRDNVKISSLCPPSSAQQKGISELIFSPFTIVFPQEEFGSTLGHGLGHRSAPCSQQVSCLWGSGGVAAKTFSYWEQLKGFCSAWTLMLSNLPQKCSNGQASRVAPRCLVKCEFQAAQRARTGFHWHLIRCKASPKLFPHYSLS